MEGGYWLVYPVIFIPVWCLSVAQARLASNPQTDDERESELTAAGAKIVQFARRLTEIAKKPKTP